MQVDGAAVEQQPAPVPNDPETERRLQEAFQQVISCACALPELDGCRLYGGRPALTASAHSACADSSVEAPPSLMPQKRYCDITGLEVRSLQPVDCSQMGKYRVGKEVPFRAPLAELVASLSLSATPCQACWRSFSNDSQASAHNQLTWLPHGPLSPAGEIHRPKVDPALPQPRGVRHPPHLPAGCHSGLPGGEGTGCRVALRWRG